MNLQEIALGLSSYWHPKVVGQVNDQYVKVAKVKGELAWHKHDNEDELFMVLSGCLTIEYKDRPAVNLQPGDFHVVPRNTLHNPVCDEECLIVLIEPETTQHTGDNITHKTVSIEQQLRG